MELSQSNRLKTFTSQRSKPMVREFPSNILEQIFKKSREVPDSLNIPDLKNNSLSEAAQEYSKIENSSPTNLQIEKAINIQIQLFENYKKKYNVRSNACDSIHKLLFDLSRQQTESDDLFKIWQPDVRKQQISYFIDHSIIQLEDILTQIKKGVDLHFAFFKALVIVERVSSYFNYGNNHVRDTNFDCLPIEPRDHHIVSRKITLVKQQIQRFEFIEIYTASSFLFPPCKQLSSNKKLQSEKDQDNRWMLTKQDATSYKNGWILFEVSFDNTNYLMSAHLVGAKGDILYPTQQICRDASFLLSEVRYHQVDLQNSPYLIFKLYQKPVDWASPCAYTHQDIAQRRGNFCAFAIVKLAQIFKSYGIDKQFQVQLEFIKQTFDKIDIGSQIRHVLETIQMNSAPLVQVTPNPQANVKITFLGSMGGREKITQQCFKATVVRPITFWQYVGNHLVSGKPSHAELIQLNRQCLESNPDRVVLKLQELKINTGDTFQFARIQVHAQQHETEYLPAFESGSSTFVSQLLVVKDHRNFAPIRIGFQSEAWVAEEFVLNVPTRYEQKRLVFIVAAAEMLEPKAKTKPTLEIILKEPERIKWRPMLIGFLPIAVFIGRGGNAVPSNNQPQNPQLNKPEQNEPFEIGLHQLSKDLKSVARDGNSLRLSLIDLISTKHTAKGRELAPLRFYELLESAHQVGGESSVLGLTHATLSVQEDDEREQQREIRKLNNFVATKQTLLFGFFLRNIGVYQQTRFKDQHDPYQALLAFLRRFETCAEVQPYYLGLDKLIESLDVEQQQIEPQLCNQFFREQLAFVEQAVGREDYDQLEQLGLLIQLLIGIDKLIVKQTASKEPSLSEVLAAFFKSILKHLSQRFAVVAFDPTAETDFLVRDFTGDKLYAVQLLYQALEYATPVLDTKTYTKITKWLLDQSELGSNLTWQSFACESVGKSIKNKIGSHEKVVNKMLSILQGPGPEAPKMQLHILASTLQHQPRGIGSYGVQDFQNFDAVLNALAGMTQIELKQDYIVFDTILGQILTKKVQIKSNKLTSTMLKLLVQNWTKVCSFEKNQRLLLFAKYALVAANEKENQTKDLYSFIMFLQLLLHKNFLKLSRFDLGSRFAEEKQKFQEILNQLGQTYNKIELVNTEKVLDWSRKKMVTLLKKGNENNIHPRYSKEYFMLFYQAILLLKEDNEKMEQLCLLFVQALDEIEPNSPHLQICKQIMTERETSKQTKIEKQLQIVVTLILDIKQIDSSKDSKLLLDQNICFSLLIHQLISYNCRETLGLILPNHYTKFLKLLSEKQLEIFNPFQYGQDKDIKNGQDPCQYQLNFIWLFFNQKFQSKETVQRLIENRLFIDAQQMLNQLSESEEKNKLQAELKKQQKNKNWGHYLVQHSDQNWFIWHSPLNNEKFEEELKSYFSSNNTINTNDEKEDKIIKSYKNHKLKLLEPSIGDLYGVQNPDNRRVLYYDSQKRVSSGDDYFTKTVKITIYEVFAEFPTYTNIQKCVVVEEKTILVVKQQKEELRQYYISDLKTYFEQPTDKRAEDIIKKYIVSTYIQGGIKSKIEIFSSQADQFDQQNEEVKQHFWELFQIIDLILTALEEILKHMTTTRYVFGSRTYTSDSWIGENQRFSSFIQPNPKTNELNKLSEFRNAYLNISDCFKH